MRALKNLEPSKVFYYFEEICGIPHGSGNTDQISNYLVDFAVSHHLKYHQDEVGNVVIYKDGTNGKESCDPVILQGHMDMVCEKSASSSHDFQKDGLKLQIKDDYLSATDTTLGGDDGIAVAYMLAVLDSEDLVHPPVEAVFTVDEEVGLTGADALDGSLLKGKRMINLDSEEDGKIWVSCAGGLTASSTFHVASSEVKGKLLTVCVNGLLGGHSGAEIDKIRANSLKLLARVLYSLSRKYEFAMTELSGGSKGNAIPLEASAKIVVSEEDIDAVKEMICKEEKDIQKEYLGSDENIRIYIDTTEDYEGQAMTAASQEKIIFFLMNIPSGVVKMSGTIENLVETSANPAILRTEGSAVSLVVSIRSSVEEAKAALSRQIEYLTEFLGGEYLVSSAYPGWEFVPDSELRETAKKVYKDLFQKEMQVVAIHAGLECGLFTEKIPGLDCVSFGPEILDIHTFSERMSISSVERNWKFIIKLLEELK